MGTAILRYIVAMGRSGWWDMKPLGCMGHRRTLLVLYKVTVGLRNNREASLKVAGGVHGGECGEASCLAASMLLQFPCSFFSDGGIVFDSGGK